MAKVEKIYAIVGARIRKARMAIGMRQDQLALKMKLERTSIVNIERGKQRIYWHYVPAFCRALKITPRQLCQGLFK